MYKLWIVSEDPSLGEGIGVLLREHYPARFEMAIWKKPGAALQSMERPDILLVEVGSENRSGFDLTRQLRAENKDLQAVFAAATKSFESIQEAMKLGASSYLLLPLSPEQLFGALDRCLEHLDQLRERKRMEEVLAEGFTRLDRYARKNIFLDLMAGDLPIQMIPSIYGWPQDGRLCAVVVWIEFDRTPGKDWAEALLAQASEIFAEFFMVLQILHKGELLFALQLHQDMDASNLRNLLWASSQAVMTACTRLLQAKTSVRSCRLWVSELCRTYPQLSRQLRTDNRIKGLSSPEPLPETMTFSPDYSKLPIPPARRSLKIQKAVLRLREGSPDRAFRQVQPYFGADHLWDALCLLIQAVLQANPQADIFSLLKAFKGKRPTVQVHHWLQRFCDGSEMALQEEGAIPQALSLIEENYGDHEFSESFVADRLGLNSSYFSRLFKKETGQTFVKALTGVRISHAKEYLSRGLSASETARLCGYRNQKYFSEAFHRSCGCPPSKYPKDGETTVL